MSRLSKGYCENEGVLAEQIKAARGEIKPQLVIKNTQFLDTFRGQFVRGDVAIHQGQIVGTCESYDGQEEIDGSACYLVPGFIDAHVHIESSLMTPGRFEELVLPLGTTTAIWDPHEIANVKGTAGIEWALACSEALAMDLFVMLPSCVPSTPSSLGLETSGAELTSADLLPFRDKPQVLGLAEMMNYPGLLHRDPEILRKLLLFQGHKRDGHCPHVSGRELNAYAVAGIHSCHESTSLAEAAEKLTKGIHVLIREGSCAKNAEELLPLTDAYTSSILALCSDDRNPADIFSEGHINAILNKGLQLGLRPEDLFRAASFSAARAYGLDDRGVIAPGYLADFCLLKLKKGAVWQAGFDVEAVYKAGSLVKKNTKPRDTQIPYPRASEKNVNMAPIGRESLRIKVPEGRPAERCKVKVIKALANQIISEGLEVELPVHNGEVLSQPERDILKIAVFERHHRTGHFSVGFVQGFNLKTGAIASSINHDSHNIIVVGASDEAMEQAVNHLIAIDGGIVVWESKKEHVDLPLPIAGLMSPASPMEIYQHLQNLKALAQKLGCTLHEPFLQLSFLALPVIPKLKITDRGLVDVEAFRLVSVLT